MSETGSSLTALSLFQEIRAFGELARFYFERWRVSPAANHHPGRTILLIPGFMAGDITLYPFAHWLRARGHHVFFSGSFANVDCPKRTVERLGRILEALAQGRDTRITVIGHSLGGIYARELARRFPHEVEQIILLGSPIHDPLHRSNPIVRALALLTRRAHEAARGCSGDLATVCGVNLHDPPPGVPETLIYSKRDGIVDWTSCVESGPEVDTVEVDSTHCALPYATETLRALVARLEADEESARAAAD